MRYGGRVGRVLQFREETMYSKPLPTSGAVLLKNTIILRAWKLILCWALKHKRLMGSLKHFSKSVPWNWKIEKCAAGIS